MTDIVIAGYQRSPFHFANKGALIKVRPDDLAAAVVKALVDKTKVMSSDLEDLIVGCAFPEGEQGFNVARLIGLAEACKGADWLITGEGRSDAQTLLGKTPFAAAKIAREHGNKTLKATLISGGVDATALAELNTAFNGGCFSIVPGPMTLDQAVIRAPELIANAAEQIARIASASK